MKKMKYRIVIKDFNPKVTKGKEYEKCVEQFDFQESNERKDRISLTHFSRKKRKETWRSLNRIN